MHFKTLTRLFLLLGMIGFLSAPLKADEIQIGSGNSTDSNLPSHSYYKYSLTQQIYTASEIEDAGGGSGTINSIAFYNAGASKERTLSIYLSNTSKTSFTGSSDWIAVNSNNLVFSGDVTLTGSAWTTISFSSPFSYDGSNLVVTVDDNTGSYSSGLSCYVYTAEETQAIYYRNDGTNPDPTNPTVSGSTVTKKNQIKLDIDLANVSCAKPKQFKAEDVTASTATLTWTAASEDHGDWEVYVTTTADDVPDENTTPTYQVTICSQALEGLTAQTTYYAYVRTVCSDEEQSKWASTSFTTTRVALNVSASQPYENDFESSCDWGFANGSLTNQWCWGSSTNNGGQKAMYVSNDGGTTYEYAQSNTMIYASKLFHFEQGTYTIVFDWQANGESTWDFLRVAMVPGDTEFTAGTALPNGVTASALPSTWIALDGGSKLNLNSSWQTQVAEAALDGTYTMVFLWRNDSSGGSQPPAAIDNISISMPSCPRPSNLTASDIEARTATLSWTVGGSESAWVLQYATNAEFSDNLVEVTEGLSANEGTVTYNLTGLSGTTTYYARVKAVCNSEDESDWSNVCNFSTTVTCEKPTLSYVSYSNTAHSGSVSWTGEANGYELAYRPASDFDASDANLEDVVRVTLGNVNTYTLEGLEAETKYYIYVQADCGEEDGKSQWSNRVIFTTLATCIAPFSLTNEGTTANSVMLSWTAGADDQDAWEFRYKKTSDSEYTYKVVEGLSTPSYTLTDLEPATNYHVNVRAYCSETDQSKWSYANQNYDLSITTECAAVSLPYFIDFEGAMETSGNFYSYPVPKCWSRIEYKYGSYSPYTYYPYVYESSSNAYNGSKSLRLYKTPNSASETAILPMIDENYAMKDLQIRFWAKAGSSDQSLFVGIMDAPDDGNTFTQIAEVGGISGTYQEYIITFSDYEGQGRYIALMCGSGSSYIYYYVDDLTVEEAPSCAIPKDLEATELTDSQVTLTWTPRGSETAWNVQYKKTSDSDWSELIPVSEASCTLTGLRRGTVYEARVQANCAVDDQSEWTYPVSFTTDCGIWPIDAENDLTQDFASSDFPPMCWNLHKVNNYYGWQYSSGQYNPLDQQGAAYSYWPTGETYMVLPQMHLDGAARLSFDMVFSGDGSGEESSVVLSTTGYEILDFTKTLWTATEFPSSKTTVTVDLSTYDAQNVYIAFKYVGVGTSGRTWYVDNIQVFVADKVFTTTGDWDVDNNWMPAGVPQNSHSVRINADATIPANCVAEADKVTIGSGSLTIADGGQLVHNNAEVEATMQKLVTGYGESTGGYALLAFPFSAEVEPSSSMLSETYDLYYYDQAYDMAEWRNYRAEPFALQSGKGYLYAHDTETTIEVTGMLNASNSEVSTPLSYSTDANPDLIGFNLVGNPFACNAYLADARDYLVLNEDGDGFVTVNGAIAPMEAVMVQASEEGSLVFTTTEPNKQAKIELSVWQQQSMVDNARIRFGEGHTLNKLSLRDDATRLSIQQDGRDYAVARADSHDEMPIAFKARRNGSYTLNINAEGVSTRYLHLIDHLTGTDVDLLQNSSYTFEAKTSDYSSRFSLVFMVGDADSDDFAFISNGRLIVANDGEATLDVIDSAGRVISSHSLNGNSHDLSINATAGVYVLRLVNGNNVKTQKIIIE